MAEVSKAGKKKMKQLHADMVEPMMAKEPPARLDVKVSDLPDIKDWDVGETYKLHLTGKMISKSEGGWDGEQPMRATFEITKASSSDDEDYEED